MLNISVRSHVSKMNFFRKFLKGRSVLAWYAHQFLSFRQGSGLDFYFIHHSDSKRERYSQKYKCQEVGSKLVSQYGFIQFDEKEKAQKFGYK